MLVQSATTATSELTKEAKQLITDAVFRAYMRYNMPLYTFESYWKLTKQSHFNLWIWILVHNPRLQNELKSDKKLTWYFNMIRDCPADSPLWTSKISAKHLKFDWCHFGTSPDNPDFLALNF